MKYCVVCRQNVQQFLPYNQGYAALSPLQKALQVVGSDIDNFSCPHCGSTDRERHLFIYLSQPGLLQRISGGNVLHFAPERYLRLLIQAQQPQQHVLADMYPNAADVQKIDMQDIGFPNDYFDLVIANHVLEHVNDYQQAIRELTRVLKPGGLAILQTPYSSILPSTIVEESASSLATREMLFGQSDHVRLYGTDIFTLISSAGLKYIGGNHQTLHIQVDTDQLGINPAEPFFLFEK
ncbi:methyltransferase domain-containing protein [Duganella sp. FT80W]|uniref:Methyltransferase domain-containing protein n=1 Tax=Duganella guangzhouensis TaxID=2666084 RepID=A0A6I2L7I0_9BURK|nr:class I SAM-dependent methyltransferase [Duganella guangzhouensis]MRW92824.1 methyltransferase domain-containing protein [Duganella guangzhouensis]